MDKVSITLNVYFENPFWVGVLERVTNHTISVCKVTFGVEPKSNELYEFILEHHFQLKFSEAMTTCVKEQKVNPKRKQREVRKLVEKAGIGTKSQQALQLQHEQLKVERKTVSKEQKEADKQRKFELKQQKRKQKHKGR